MAAGADAILLIVAALGPGAGALLAPARGARAGRPRRGARRARARRRAALGAAIIGINNRDLNTLEVDTSAP